jgi:hypothetical protein
MQPQPPRRRQPVCRSDVNAADPLVANAKDALESVATNRSTSSPFRP